MTRDYRPVPEDRHAEFRSMVRYAFNPTAGREEVDETDLDDPRYDLGERRGIFVGDDLRTVCRHYFFSARLRGEDHALAGLSAVATPPEHRRQGLVRDLLVESLAEYRERDVAFSALWPFSRPFYAQFGWATANRYRETRLPPAALRGLGSDTAGTLRPVDPDEDADVAALDVVYAAAAGDTALSIERTAEWWRHRVLRDWEDDPYAYLLERDGQPRGYVVYGVTDEGDDRELRVRDLAGRSPADVHRLFGFLGNHDSQVDTVVVREGDDSDLLALVEDPGPVEQAVKTGPMVRLVDVPAALERLDPAAQPGGTVVCAVSDPLVGANDGRFRLTLADGVAVEAVGGDTDSGPDPDVSLTVGGLSQLAVGSRSLAALTRTGAATVHDQAAADRLAAAFPPVRTLLRDFF